MPPRPRPASSLLRGEQFPLSPPPPPPQHADHHHQTLSSSSSFLLLLSTHAAFTNGDISTVSLDDYLGAGKYVVLAFYPKDFTYVCPTEIIAFSDRAREFEEAGAQVLVASTDTEEVHGAWTRVARSAGGLGKISIPMIADTKKTISAAYGCEYIVCFHF